MSKRIIIGVSGKFASGKTTVARHLEAHYGFTAVHFADKLKEVCRDLFEMEGKDRTLLQQVGEAMRGVDRDVWVKYLLRHLPAEGRFVIDDMRHSNEYDLLRQEGGIAIRLNCPKAVLLARYQRIYGQFPTKDELRHPSETALDAVSDWDFVVSTDRVTKEEMLEAVDDLMTRILREH